MTFKFSVPTPIGPKEFEVASGTSVLFVGANGGGKTRLAAKIENDLGAQAHRIGAHRALSLNPTVAKINEEQALRGLRMGHPDPSIGLQHRIGQRWQQKAAVYLLNDYDYLLQALFADQTNTSLKTHKHVRAGGKEEAAPTKFERLVDIWDRLLPHRKLEITGDDIRVVASSGEIYAASDMSDGERAIFYLIGQALAAAPNSLLIFDEPELHIHRSIMSRLWDEIEAARPDCGMVLISHDLEFAASREGQKFVLRNYDSTSGWTIDEVPAESGFSEEVATLILGSRKPVLFVEGQGGSLDRAIYRACYPDWTIIPRGSCEEVIHATVTMRANSVLTRITCAGIVDADAYDADDEKMLQAKGVGVLPVSEIENLFLLPSVTKAIVESEGYTGDDASAKVSGIQDALFAFAAEPKHKEPVVMAYVRRRIDRILKRIDLSAATTVAELAARYTAETEALDLHGIAKLATDAIDTAIAKRDVGSLLRWFDNKGLMGIACRAKGTNLANFEQWIVRAMLNGTVPSLSKAIGEVLPSVKPT